MRLLMLVGQEVDTLLDDEQLDLFRGQPVRLCIRDACEEMRLVMLVGQELDTLLHDEQPDLFRGQPACLCMRDACEEMRVRKGMYVSE